MIKHILMIGCGHMGYAMLRRWVELRVAAQFSVITPRLESLHGLEAKGVRHFADVELFKPEAPPDVLIFAVKPQILAEVLLQYRAFNKALMLSVAAAKPLSLYEGIFGNNMRMVRAMPNLAVKLGQGVTLLAANAQVDSADKRTVETLLKPLGLVAWLVDEGQMDAGAALSGCGPAYFYLLAEALAEAGAALGLAPDLAATLAKQTLMGSAALWQDDPSSGATLYQSIAVKGGMTEAALIVLQQDNALKNLMQEALKAAVLRAKNLR